MHEKKGPIPDVPTRAIILHYSHFSHTATTVRLLSIERKAQHRLRIPADADQHSWVIAITIPA